MGFHSINDIVFLMTNIVLGLGLYCVRVSFKILEKKLKKFKQNPAYTARVGKLPPSQKFLCALQNIMTNYKYINTLNLVLKFTSPQFYNTTCISFT